MSKEKLIAATSEEIAKLVWTANTELVVPLTLQDFNVGAVMPAVFFMLRRGRRRGKGRFGQEYASIRGRRSRALIRDVAEKLATASVMEGFEDSLRREVLEDLLMEHVLETRNRSTARDAEVRRVYPVHFFASWVDLPDDVSNLRFVPELIVTLLADQRSGDFVEQGEDERFPIGSDPERNLLLKPFSKGVRFCVNPNQLNGDGFDESAVLALDELLSVRVGLGCQSAPETLATAVGGKLQNLRPLSRRSAVIFREDLAAFIEAFGEAMPRRALTQMLETIIGLGLWHTFLASLRCAVEWEQAGRVPPEVEQKPPSVFVDASGGAVAELRRESERSVEGVLALLDEANVAMACIRVITAYARFSPRINRLKTETMDTAQWLGVLGSVRRGDAPEAAVFLEILATNAEALREALAKEDACPPAQASLEKHALQDPVRALGEALVELMGHKLLRSSYLDFLDSVGMDRDPHGLLRNRKVRRRMPDGRQVRTEVRSVVLSNELLEALVHTHLVGKEFPLSYAEFLALLRERYGLCVDEAPNGLDISQDLLLRNREVLERRLRDLGLLTGVNDAESMKLLRARYRSTLAATL
ncbi:MAG: hypothetical protein ACK41F_10185 [Fimbriimonadaceae bacterium]